MTVENNKANVSFKYLLALINSKLFTFYYRNRLVTNLRSIAQIKKMHLDTLPICRIDFSNKKEKALHDKLVSLVEVMLELHKKLSSARTPDARVRVERQIAATDAQIDALVYDLYGLTDEEIKIVEGS